MTCKTCNGRGKVQGGIAGETLDDCEDCSVDYQAIARNALSNTGDRSAFPHEFTPGDKQWSGAGMTYRQWLVGMVASGLDGTQFRDSGEYAKAVTHAADAIVKRLEANE